MVGPNVGAEGFRLQSQDFAQRPFEEALRQQPLKRDYDALS
jgi:hypothetical protein